MNNVLSIDAINVRSGGGVAHIVNLLECADPCRFGFKCVHIWANKDLASRLKHQTWLKIHTPFWADYNLLLRILFHSIFLPYYLKKYSSSLLFSPTATLPPFGLPTSVILLQNMLPFERTQIKLFNLYSPARIKFFLLRLFYLSSIRRSRGVIFLSLYAYNSLKIHVNSSSVESVVVPHGVDTRFFKPPRTQHEISRYSFAQPFRIVYVSPFLPYKHQVTVARACHMLRQSNIPVQLDFVGDTSNSYFSKFLKAISSIENFSDFINVVGKVEFSSLHHVYHQADLFVFASSCENLPITLVEAMASGLPIACSIHGSMQEVLKDGGAYFNSHDVNDLYSCLLSLIKDPLARRNYADKAFLLSHQYSWQTCSNHTLSFMSKVLFRS